jgi:8-amino-7-oxononanoate synthase
MSAAALRLGSGAGASHLVCGHGPEHEALERELAEFTGRESALLFSSGYMANLGVVTALAGRGETVLQDKLNHASLLDAAQLSGATLRRYTHLDAQAAARIAASSEALAVVATDGVFSMDGDQAPLQALAPLARESRAWLVVDDAHGLGVCGATGAGSCEQQGLSSDDVPVLVGTFGKAFGSFGAFVAGSGDVIDFLTQRARTAIYTTALPQAVAAATRAGLRVARRDGWRREKVFALTRRFRERAAMRGVALTSSLTPIQPVIVGDAAQALRVSEALLSAGFWVSAIRPPTVPQGSARLRVTLSAAHEETAVDGLVDALARALEHRAP